MISNIANRVTTTQHLTQLNELMQMLMDADYLTQNAINNYQTTAESNINWLTTNLADIELVIKDGGVTEPTTMPTTMPTTVTTPTTQSPQTTTGGADSFIVSSIVLFFSIAIKFIL